MFFNIQSADRRPLPNRVRAAQSYIEFCRAITEPCCEDDTSKRRKLTPKELSAYEASIETIRAYIVGELNLGDTPVEPAVTQPQPDQSAEQTH